MTEDRQSQLIGVGEQVLMQNYRQQPAVMTRGEGVHLYDVAGTRYLDMTAGIAVCCLGHAHPALEKALCAQAGRLLHTSNLYHIEQQILAANRTLDETLHELLMSALDEPLPEGAEQRCIERVRESQPIPIISRQSDPVSE